jgi:DNA polymerase
MTEQISLFDLLEPEPDRSVPTSEFTDLDQLITVASQCQKCPLGATRTKIVVERGNRNAPVMVIGEGPGQNEDEQGIPFVGKAGQLLDKILASVDLNPDRDVYICNVVKCRPPGNRVPTDEEMETCKPYLLSQIRFVNPKIILLTGATAVRAITGDKRGITKIRGTWLEWEGRWVMPIFHPAYLLRNQSREPGSPKWLMWQDIQGVKQKLTELL